MGNCYAALMKPNRVEKRLQLHVDRLHLQDLWLDWQQISQAGNIYPIHSYNSNGLLSTGACLVVRVE